MQVLQCTIVFALIAILLSISAASVFAQTEEMNVSAQQEFNISLPSNPSTGYQWTVKEISDKSVIKYVNSTFTPDADQMPGSGGTEVLTFWAEKDGSATITLEYLRSWEPDNPAETRTISVTVGGDSMDTIPGPITLSGLTGPQGKYNVTVLWFSSDIGQENNFSIYVVDAETGEEVYDGLTMDFSIVQGDNMLVSKQLTGPAVPNTNETQYAYGDKYAFESEGSYLLRIGNINDSGENVEFPMQVTPEFGSAAILIVVISGLVVAIAAARFAGVMPANR